jgi:hypothetical protein
MHLKSFLALHNYNYNVQRLPQSSTGELLGASDCRGVQEQVARLTDGDYLHEGTAHTSVDPSPHADDADTAAGDGLRSARL